MASSHFAVMILILAMMITMTLMVRPILVVDFISYLNYMAE